MSEVKYTGSCLCEAVKYTVTAEPVKFYFCHCEQCRKITGSAFASNILTKVAEVEWKAGSDKVKRFDLPERSFTKVFCSDCGSGLPFLTQNKRRLIIPAGSLDCEAFINPSNNIFWAERAAWYDEGVKSKCCDGFPL